MSLADYMSDEKKKADNDHSGDGFSSLPLKDQRTYIDGVNSGAITEGPRLWQQRVQQNIDKQRQDAGIIRDVYGDEMDPAINGAPSNVAGPAGPTPGRNTQITGRGGAARME
jgi:hypothetical protein